MYIASLLWNCESCSVLYHGTAMATIPFIPPSPQIPLPNTLFLYKARLEYPLIFFNTKIGVEPLAFQMLLN